MTQEKPEWMVSGDLVEGCTSPPVCPLYWGSPPPKDAHDGESRCEGVWSFNIREGYCGDTDLSGLKVSFGFNTPAGYPQPQGRWKSILFIDETANEAQAKALEDIYTKCWTLLGEVLKVKRAKMSFTKELVDGGPAARHVVEIGDVYRLKSEPLRTPDGKPRSITGMFGGVINIGKSEVNEFRDADLPHTWNAPGMSTTYYDFALNPNKTFWMP